MKKIIAMLLATALVLAFVSCGNGGNETTGSTTVETTTTPSTSVETTTETTVAPETTVPASKDVVPTVDATTVGGQYWAAFVEFVKANPEAKAFDIVDALSQKEIFPGMMMPANPADMAFYPGFMGIEKPEDFVAQTGSFDEVALFSPMIGTLPFVCYVFDVADGVDVAAFAKNVETNANPRWNICTEAEQKIVGTQGNYVFLIMCPASIEG